MKRLTLGSAAILGISTLVAGTSVNAQERPKPLMKDFMGINGHTIQFDAKLYAPVCRLVRDYHNLYWDVAGDTSRDTQFPLAGQKIKWEDKSGKWKSFDDVPNWQEIYGSWQEAGFEVDVCIQFGGLTLDKWKNPAEDAYRYGKAFAQYFGPSGEAKLVTSVEIGNEPSATFKPEEYLVLFEAMARGIRDGDPNLKILTATMRGGKADRYSLPADTFKGKNDLYDVLNVHIYSFKEHWPTYLRSHPEDPTIEYLQVLRNTAQWRDENAPGKEIWVTEFGYDSSTQQPPADSQFKLVSDTVQAQWIVRSYLEFSAMDVQRAYLYWFNDGDTPSLHAASGITRNYEPKPSYYAMRHLYQSLGDYRFAREVEKKPGELHIYEYIHGQDPNQRVQVIWSPTGDGQETTITRTFEGQVVKAERMPLTDGPAEQVDVSGEILVTESPLYVWITVQ